MQKKISCFGYGKTTKAIAKHHPCNFYADNVKETFVDEDGNTIFPASEFNPEESNIEIPSPAIPPSNELIKQSKNLVSDYDFFADSIPFSIWISGTNGKTTTTQMIDYMLKDKGVATGGNIGTPLANLDKDAPIWVLETSSFTLHYTNKAKPNIYILLPITPDHLSWHGSFKEYEEAKLKPLKFMQEGEAVILPKKYSHVKTAGFKILYDDAEDLAKYFEIDMSKVKFKGVFLVDALIAMGVDKLLYNRINYEKINSFNVDAHRQEEVYDVHKRLWVNDSKATNLDASLVAVERYKESNIHLILGGDTKGVDLSELIETLRDLHVKVYSIGTSRDYIFNLCQKNSVTCQKFETMVEAMKEIDTVMSQGDIALLSPAAASLDQFSSYAQRGEIFKDFVLNLS